jgi:hypothetical protein
VAVGGPPQLETIMVSSTVIPNHESRPW